jgi:hypothetical protein
VLSANDCFRVAYSTLQSRTGLENDHAFRLIWQTDGDAALTVVNVALLSSDSEQRDEASRELETARALMRETGAMLFENFISTRDLGQSSPRQISTKAS